MTLILTALLSLCLYFQTFVDVIGTEGRLTLNRPFVQLDETRQLTFYPVTGDASILDIQEKELYLGQIEDMNAAILDGTQQYLSLEESRNNVATVLALYESATRGETIELS